MELVRIGADFVRVPTGRRPVDMERVKALAESIDKIGLQTPVTVWMERDGDNDVPHLVAGAHRVAACKMLGIDVDAFVTNADEIDRELWEIAENLHRAELTKEQRDAHIRRYAELLRAREEAERERALQSPQIAAIESKRADGRGHRPKGIARKIAEETGLSDDTVRRALNPRPAAPRLVPPPPDPLNEDEARDKWLAAGMTWWNRGSHEWREEFLARIDGVVFDRTHAGAA